MFQKVSRANIQREWLFWVGVICGIVVASPLAFGQRNPCAAPNHEQGIPNARDTDPGHPDYGLYLDPVPGLTTARHVAPSRFAVPKGTILTMFQSACALDDLAWDGATPQRREAMGATATCPMDVPGLATVRVQVFPENGPVVENVCEVEVLDLELADIRIRGIGLGKSGLSLTENATNEETMAHYFGPSIAAIRQVGPNHYVTSVDRELSFNAFKLRPSRMAELTEWRVDDRPVALGAALAWRFAQVGGHRIEVGPPGLGMEVLVDTYSVRISRFTPAADIIPEGTPVTFTAITEPPGLEDEITWISSTKYGTGTPVLGHGPTFTVQFENTFGPNPNGGFVQWLGVKADNVVRGQDAGVPTTGLCCIDEASPCVVTTQLECEDTHGGSYAGDGTDCDSTTLELPVSPNFARAGCGGLPACPAGAVAAAVSKRRCCKLLGTGTPLNDTFWSGTVNTGAAGLAGAASISLTVKVPIVESCTSALGGAGAIKTFSCDTGSCVPAGQALTVEVLNGAGAAICCQGFTKPAK